MRRATVAALLAGAIGACDAGAPLAPAPLASLTGVWMREWPPSPPNAEQPFPQRLVLLDGGRYRIDAGDLVRQPAGPLGGATGWIEHGRVREEAGGLQWTVDSLERFEPGMPTAPVRRTVERDVIFIEGHPFANAVARRSGTLLVLSGRNASIGAPADFTARFRRRGGLAATDAR